VKAEELARRLGKGDAKIAEHERRLNSINGSIKGIDDKLAELNGTASGLIGQMRGIERLWNQMQAQLAAGHTPETCPILPIVQEAQTKAESAEKRIDAARSWLGGWRAALVLVCAAALGGSAPRFLDVLSRL